MLRNQLRMTVVASALVGTLVAGPVLAEGNTSGPSAGSNVTPSTTMQKQHQSGARTGSGQQGTTGEQQSASGDAGIEAKPGTEGGASPEVPAQ
jgi:hypothetical protein